MKASWLSGMSVREFAERLWKGISEDDIFGRSAQLSYYFLLALIPLLLFMTSVFGLLMGSNFGLRQSLFSYLADVMPRSAYELIDQAVNEVADTSSGSKVSFGLLAALWVASNGMGAVTGSLNAAYGVVETRSWWWRRLIAINLTLALAVFILSALLLVLYGGQIVEMVSGSHGWGPALKWTWLALQWPIAFAFILLAFGLIYFFCPDVRVHKFVWITPGTVVGAVLWLAVSFGLKIYLDHFNSYSKTYGSLGAVIILMLWLYLTGVAVLIGGKINSEIEHAAGRSGRTDAKEKGERCAGDKERLAAAKTLSD